MNAALDNLLVVSLEQAVAAPYCSRIFAEGGARVIKLERPEGDFARAYDTMIHGDSGYFVWLNGGKESVTVDLARDADKQLLDKLLARADVFVQNLRPGAVDRLGYGWERLHALNPRLVMCSISGYGLSGPYADMKAYDALIQAESLLLLDGGAETTRTVIAHSIVNFIRHPEQWQKLVADPSLIPVAVEECIRYVTPILNMCRHATADTELHGVPIRKGQQVVLMYSSANRDPAHFADPEAFDVSRQPNHHIAFGFGTHFCLGASLARLEIRVMFEELVRRITNLRLVEEPVLVPGAFVLGMESAVVEFDAR